MIRLAQRKDKIQRILVVICFICIGILLHNQIYRVMRIKTKESRNYIDSFYDLPQNKADILILGSSHAYCGVQPNEFWGNYGYSSYVLGSPSQSIPCSYYLLKEALNRQKPKVVFLEVYYARFDRLYVNPGMLRHVTDGMRMGKVKHEMIQDILKNKGWKVKAAFYLPFMKYHGRWNDLKPYDFYWTRWLLGGSPTSSIKKQTYRPVPDEKSDLPANVILYLDKIHRLCEENGIQFVLFETPLADNKKTNYMLPYFVALEDYARERGIPFLFEQKYGLADIDYERDFRNSSHLNSHGAKKITLMLGEYLKENFPQTDHRGDPAYDYWEKCYQSYEEYFAKKKITL